MGVLLGILVLLMMLEIHKKIKTKINRQNIAKSLN